MRDLSVLIPANNEVFLKNTIEDILAHIEADTEVIAVLDGRWADPPVDQHPRVNIIYAPEAIGQRAATNLACKLSRARYVMKVDAHCSFDQGFDRKMIEAFKEVGDNVTMVPLMRNLYAFDWKCMKCGRKLYQDYKPICPDCGNKMERKMIWRAKSGSSMSYLFDARPHFDYFNEYRMRKEFLEAAAKDKMTESMSIQGSCFMLTREKYWELNICDEAYGSWGNQGIEVACKMWLSGGRIVSNHRTWYAHMFRTKPQNGFGFPWKRVESEIQITKKAVWDDVVGFKLPKQIYPVSWLIEKFSPVPTWTPEKIAELKLKQQNGKTLYNRI
jgi:ribosomal protein L37E